MFALYHLGDELSCQNGSSGYSHFLMLSRINCDKIKATRVALVLVLKIRPYSCRPSYQERVLSVSDYYAHEKYSYLAMLMKSTYLCTHKPSLSSTVTDRTQ